jgi:quercetin dioxygenase-like cupin family protein
MTLISKSTASAIFLAAAALFNSNAAFAGACPAGKTGMDLAKSGPMTPAGVTDTVISSVDLKTYGAEGRQLRMRRLVVQPGGVVPWHSHAERPAHILVVSGEITEYSSSCATPITHKAGEVTAESGNTSHWWKNNSKQPSVLISADVLPPSKSADGMM